MKDPFSIDEKRAIGILHGTHHHPRVYRPEWLEAQRTRLAIEALKRKENAK